MENVALQTKWEQCLCNDVDILPESDVEIAALGEDFKLVRPSARPNLYPG